MIGNNFIKTVFISFLGHLTVFSIFSFSFGMMVPKADYINISFLGQILRASDLSSHYFNSYQHNLDRKFNKKTANLLLGESSKEYFLVLQKYSKPPAVLTDLKERIIFAPKNEIPSPFKNTEESIIMFYPHLPLHFLLYFKDRQTVHIELMFIIISDNRTNHVAIKRKISSGNLEADLLSMRYISHYLFIQQGRFSLNNWQTVKIDLSANND